MEEERLIETDDPDTEEPASQSSSEPFLTTGKTELLTTVTCIDVENLADVRIGDTIIRNPIVNEEEVKDPQPPRIWCKIVLFVCCIIIGIFAVALSVFVCIIPERQTRLDLDIWYPWYLRRAEWLPMAICDEDFLKLPVKYAIIMHSGTESCDQKDICIQNLQETLTRYSVKNLEANFLIGGHGWVFEGKGANIKSPLMLGWEDNSINIMFIGNYEKDEPDKLQFDHGDSLLETLVQIGVLHPDYELYGSCQLATYTVDPGPKLLKKLGLFKHWNPVNLKTCLPGLM